MYKFLNMKYKDQSMLMAVRMVFASGGIADDWKVAQEVLG